MIDLCLQFLSSAFPEKLKLHPYWMVGLGIVGLIFVVYGAISWLFGGRKEPAAAATVPPSAPSAMASMGPVTFTPIFNNQTGGGALVNGDEAILAAQKKVVERPEPNQSIPSEQLLQFGRVEYATVRLDRGSIDKSERGEEGVLFPVYNLTPKVLAKGRNYDLAAHLVFYEEENIIANIARGYWLGKSFNDIGLKIGDNAFVVLGFRNKPGVWTALGNRFVRPTTQFGNITIPLADKKIFAVEREIQAEVTLVNIHSGEVVARCSFAISPNGDEEPAVRRL
jgi:hypothetical protein